MILSRILNNLRILRSGVLLFFASLILTACSDAPAEKPTKKLAVMTSLPIFWGEGDIKQALEEQGRSPILKRMQTAFDVEAIDNFDELEKRKLLLLAQPRALAPEEFVKLDKWVRDGGNLLILADPALRWESEYPLGDKRRPLFTSLLSPLLKHWGLTLSLPMGEDAISNLSMNGMDIETATIGLWDIEKLDGNCTLASNAALAQCDIDKGRAILLADADLLDPQYWAGEANILGNGDSADNMDWLLTSLDSLSK